MTREFEMARSSSGRTEPRDDATAFVPDSRSVTDLTAAVQACTACPLYIDTTQAVFGQGSRSPRLILVGEQPGDVEDRRGLPFVGPAGRVLWECVEAAGIDRRNLYATNAVKHFKHTNRGKRRLHKKPSTDEIEACHPWLDAELGAFPKANIVALGATAARSVLGRTVTISAGRLAPTMLGSRTVFVTYHPSAVLRADDRAAEVRAALVADLTAAWAASSRPRAVRSPAAGGNGSAHTG
jgi:uracil-DNA glycosylase family protein